MHHPTAVRTRSRTLVVLGLALAAAARTLPAADSVVACTVADIDKWKEARRTSLGVKATDRSPGLAPEVIPSPGVSPDLSCPTEVDFASDQDGRANDGIHDWVFAAPCKVTACGEPRSFEQNRALFWFSGEYDLNNNIAIEDDFSRRYLRRHLCFDDEAPGSENALLARQEPRLCFAPTETLHAEITPPPRLRPLLRRAWTEDWPYGWIRWKETLRPTLPWPGSEASGEAPRARVCAYGPFVADTGHAARAEIHPVQLLWWKENGTPSGARTTGREDDVDRVDPLALFVMQDASARYTKPHHFVLSKAPPGGSGWRPWAEAPVDGMFTIPFWSNPADPPRFRLDPYKYEGTSGGAPASVACDEKRVTALTAEARRESATASPEETVASFCKAVWAEPPSDVQVDVRVDCYCDPARLRGGECPGGTRGYLGRIVVRAETGRRRDWSEGSLAMLLWDQRPLEGAPRAERAGAEARAVEAPEARGARFKQLAEALEAPGPAPTGIVTWKPAAGTGWQRVVPRGAEIGRVQGTIDRLFSEAGWPASVRRPLPSLWRLKAVDLDADAVVEDLGEGSRKSKRVRAEYKGPRATELRAGSEAGQVLTLDPPARLSEHSARLTLPSGTGEGGAQELWRLEVPATITVEYRDRNGLLQTREAMPPDRGKARGAEGRAGAEGLWTLWTHGLGTRPLEDWTTDVSALCDHFVSAQESASTPVTPPRDDLRTILHRTTKDEVVSLTELRLLVAAVRDLCGGEPVARSRPVPVQSK